MSRSPDGVRNRPGSEEVEPRDPRGSAACSGIRVTESVWHLCGIHPGDGQEGRPGTGDPREQPTKDNTIGACTQDRARAVERRLWGDDLCHDLSLLDLLAKSYLVHDDAGYGRAHVINRIDGSAFTQSLRQGARIAHEDAAP